MTDPTRAAILASLEAHMPVKIPTDTHPEITASIRAHMAARGMSATGLARAMKRSHTWILRKLDLEHPEARGLTTADLAAIATHLGITAAELLTAPAPAPAT